MLRFASSPTEDMDVDTLRIAILNYLVAQQRNEGFIIRIDDLDKVNTIEGKDTEIMQILEKFALKHDSVFHQSEHLHMYQTLAIRLLEEGKAFVCTCSKEQTPYSGCCENVDKSEHAKLKKSETPFVIRIKKPKQSIIFHDFVLGDVINSVDDVDAFVILHKDGTPTEVFASACDDMLSGITTVIEKEANLRNTARALHIKKELGYIEETSYAHLLAMNNTPVMKTLFKEGYAPDAIINYLLLLTYSSTPKEIFTLPEAIEWFKIEDSVKSSVTFEMDKLRHINREHLKNMDDKALSTLFGFADKDIGKLAKLYLGEVSTIKELKAKIEAIFTPKDFQGKWTEHMRTLERLIQDAPMFQDFSAFESYLLKESKLSDEAFYVPLRVLLTGTQNGPELSDIYPHIKSYILEIAS